MLHLGHSCDGMAIWLETGKVKRFQHSNCLCTGVMGTYANLFVDIREEYHIFSCDKFRLIFSTCRHIIEIYKTSNGNYTKFKVHVLVLDCTVVQKVVMVVIGNYYHMALYACIQVIRQKCNVTLFRYCTVVLRMFSSVVVRNPNISMILLAS